MDGTDAADGASTPSSAVGPSTTDAGAQQPSAAASGAANRTSAPSTTDAEAQQPSVAASGATTPTPTDIVAQLASVTVAASGATLRRRPSATAAAAVASLEKQQALGISLQEPPLPVWPTPEEIVNGTAPPVIDFKISSKA